MGRLTALIVVVLAAGLIAAAAHARPAPSTHVLRDSLYRLTSDFASDTLLVRELEFDAPLLFASVDSTSGTLVVSLQGDRQDPGLVDSYTLFREARALARTLIYDLQRHQVTWSGANDGLLAYAATQGRAFLGKADGRTALIRLPDGRRLGDVNGTTHLWRDGVAVTVTDRAIYRLNLADGSALWTGVREVGGYLDEVIRVDSMAFIVAEGIQKLDLWNGPVWSFRARTSRKNFYGLPGGGTVHMPTLYGGNRAQAMASLPLIVGDDVFFAADTMVVRLHSRTGKVLWRTPLRMGQGFSLRQRALGLPSTQEFLGRLLVRDAGLNVAVASLGWASGPKTSWLADRPSLALLSKEDGQMLARVEVPGVQILNDAWSTESGHYLIAHDRVLWMDDRLSIRATFKAPLDLQPLGSFIELSDHVVFTTGSGIAALSGDSLKLAWSHPCGRLLAIERYPDWVGDRYVVTTQGVLRLETGSGHAPTAYYPLRGSWATFVESGLMIGNGPTLRIVVLPDPVYLEPEKPSRVD